MSAKMTVQLLLQIIQLEWRQIEGPPGSSRILFALKPVLTVHTAQLIRMQFLPHTPSRVYTGWPCEFVWQGYCEALHEFNDDIISLMDGD